MPCAVLLIEDDQDFAGALSRFLEKEGHTVEWAPTGEEGLRRFPELAPDIVLLDLVLPGMDGLRTFEALKRLDEGAAVIVMTAHGSVASAVDAMRLGALDFLAKPIDLEALAAKLDRTKELLGLQSDLRYVLDRERRSSGFQSFIGSSSVMQAIYDRIREVAKTDSTTVLVTGESGTGKELTARAIHSLSARHRKPLMQIDCAAIPITLLESELFGHERGAFTGADRGKKGLLELADGGTLLLDEIGDMDLALQSKFLRVLQERQFRRIGGTRDLGFDVRVIAATNQPLEQLVEQGRFRRDLLYRLKVFQIALPPLRDRREDILELADAFVRQYAQTFRKPVRGLDEAVRRQLIRYSFPGNVRELRNLVEQAVILAQGELITPTQLSVSDPSRPVAAPTDGAGAALDLDALGDHPLEAAERELIRQAMERAGGQKKAAAELLGISRFSLQRKLDRLALDSLKSK